MNRERARELLPIIQAFAEGKTVQYRSEISNGWRDAKTPSFENDKEYRIKPEPREFWIGNARKYTNPQVYETLTEAREDNCEETFKVREVLDD